MQMPDRAGHHTLLRRTLGPVKTGQAFPSLNPKTLTLVFVLMLRGDVELVNPGPEAIRCVCSSEAEEEGLTDA